VTLSVLVSKHFASRAAGHRRFSPSQLRTELSSLPRVANWTVPPMTLTTPALSLEALKASSSPIWLRLSSLFNVATPMKPSL
jgi:hypothetical protein